MPFLIKIIENKLFLKHSSYLIILFIVFLIVYYKATSLFFRQDEWLGFGLIIGYGKEFIYSKSITDLAHFVPVALSIDYLLFKFAHLNPLIFNLFGLAFHLINTFLIYLIAGNFSKNKILSAVAAMIFITSSVASQLVLWTVISINTLSLTFALLSFWLLLNFNEFKHRSLVGYLIAIGMVCSLLILEYSAGFIILIPTAVLIYRKKLGNENLKKILIPLAIAIVSFLILRLVLLLQASVGSVQSSLSTGMMYRAVEFPIRYLGQIVIPEHANLFLSNIILGDPERSETFFFKIIAICTGFLSILFLGKLLSITKKLTEERDNLIVLIIFILSSSLPFVIIPGQSSDFTIFPGRYLYFGLAGYAILLSLVAKMLIQSKNNYLKVAVCLFILISCFYGVYDNLRQIRLFSEEDQVRLNILNTIKSSYPKLPEKTVFFIESDSAAYGLPYEVKILPFQSGFGQTLLVWYYGDQYIPKGFYKDRFLWDIKSEGYKEIEGYGFGYFRDFEKVKKTVKDYQLPLDCVISFSWKKDSNLFLDTTKETRSRLERNR